MEKKRKMPESPDKDPHLQQKLIRRPNFFFLPADQAQKVWRGAVGNRRYFWPNYDWQGPAENASDSCLVQSTQYFILSLNFFAIWSTLNLVGSFPLAPGLSVAGELVRSQTSSSLRLSFAAPMQPVPTTNSPAGTILAHSSLYTQVLSEAAAFTHAGACA